MSFFIFFFVAMRARTLAGVSVVAVAAVAIAAWWRAPSDATKAPSESKFSQVVHKPRAPVTQKSRKLPGKAKEVPVQRATPPPSPHFCLHCRKPFTKQKTYEAHTKGKRHQKIVAEADTFWSDYAADPMWFDNLASPEAVRSVFSFDVFFSGLPRRTRSSSLQPLVGAKDEAGSGCLAPHLTIGSLPCEARAQLWRYLREAMPQLPYALSLPALMSTVPDKYRRVKEILECVEAFKKCESLILRARQTGTRTIETVYDLACGQGLVGVMLALRFSKLCVLSIDFERRNSFDAFVERWQGQVSAEDHHRIRFVEGNFNAVMEQQGIRPGAGGSSLFLCLHGCNEANRDAHALAQHHGGNWLLMPCCVRSGIYLPESVRIGLSDDTTRYTFMVGAMANIMNPEVVSRIDSRITNKNIILSGAGWDKDSGTIELSDTKKDFAA
jgi:hypothetical protein